MDGKDIISEEQVVVFQLFDQVYGVDIALVHEIIRMEVITKIPRTPDFIEGVINLRGRIIPVIDLRRRFGLEKAEKTATSRIIVVEVDRNMIGMVVDAVLEVLRIPRDKIEPPPPMVHGIEAVYLKGIALWSDRLIILFDLGKVLYEREKEQLEPVYQLADLPA
ncbi:MAG: chemotaxis protein CheW [Peptococcaceae bacterium]|nr:MAG: chemotaxis protein CheW [Peptococcaceae bacterium]